MAESGLSFWGNSIGLNDRYWEKQTFRFQFLKNRSGTTAIHPEADIQLLLG